MVKVIALIKRQPSLSHDEFRHHWHVEHPPLVWALPGLRRYVQNPSVQGSRAWAFDGAAELWFDSIKDVAIAFDSSRAAPMHAHEKAFIDDIVWFLADEIDVPRTKAGDGVDTAPTGSISHEGTA